MKCLEKDRGRRYETANGLAADLQRHLSNEPIIARPPSNLYRLQKLARRNKGAFSAAAAITILLVAGVIVSSWQAIRATKAERRNAGLLAKAEAAQASEEKQRKASESQLYDSLLGEAKFRRQERQAGYRDKVFEVLQRANALSVPQKNLADLRTAAVACMIDPTGNAPITFRDFPQETKIRETIIHPSGELAAFRLMNGTIQVRKLPSGQILQQLVVRDMDPDSSIETYFHGKGDRLACGHSKKSKEKGLAIWTRATDAQWREQPFLPFLEHWNWVYSADRDFLCVADAKPGFHRLVDLITGEVALSFEVSDVDFLNYYYWAIMSPDGWFFALVRLNSNTVSSVLEWWEVKTGRKIASVLWKKLPQQAGLGFSPDGKYLATLTDSGGRIFSTETGEQAAEVAGNYSRTFLAYFAPQGTVIALPSQAERAVRLWDWTSQRNLVVWRDPSEGDATREAVFSPKGDFVLTSGRWSASLYPLRRSQERIALPVVGYGLYAASAAAFGSHGTRVALVTRDWVAQVHDVETGEKLWEVPKSTMGSGKVGPLVAMNPDGLLAVPVLGSREIEIWDEPSRNRLGVLSFDQPGTCLYLQFSQDGKFLAGVNQSDSVSGPDLLVWEVQAQSSAEGVPAMKARLARKPEKVSDLNPNAMGLRIPPDNRRLAILLRQNMGLSPGTFRLFTLDRDDSSSVPLVSYAWFAVTPDSRRVLAFGAKRELMTLDIATGLSAEPAFPTRLGDPQPEVTMELGPLLYLSPGGKRLAIATPNRFGVYIWDWEAKRFLYTLPDQTGPTCRMVWSPDSQRLIVGRENSETELWNLQAVERALAEIGLMDSAAKSASKERALP